MSEYQRGLQRAITRIDERIETERTLAKGGSRLNHWDAIETLSTTRALVHFDLLEADDEPQLPDLAREAMESVVENVGPMYERLVIKDEMGDDTSRVVLMMLCAACWACDIDPEMLPHIFQNSAQDELLNRQLRHVAKRSR